MEPKQHYLAVGAFVIAAIVGVLAFVVWLANISERGSYDTYQTFVSESVNGLSVGSAVKYRGVDVGKVTKIDIPEKNPNKVRIVMDIDDETPITVGTVAVIQMQGITGVAYIELRGAVAGGEKIPLVGNNKIPIIPSAPSEFRQIVDTVPDMLQKFTELANKLQGFASDENQEKFANILANLESFSQDVGPDENGTTMIQQLRDTAAQVKQSAATIGDIAEHSRKDTERLLRQSAETVDKIGQLTETTGELTAKGYHDLHQLLLELKKTARELQDLSRNLKENPSRIIFPERRGGVKAP